MAKQEVQKARLVKMEPTSFRIMAVTFAIFLFILGLAAVGTDTFRLERYLIDIITFAAVIIFFVEIGLMQIIKKQGKGIGLATSIELIVGVLMLISVILNLFGIGWGSLQIFRGWISMIFGLAFLIEAFAR